MFIGKINLKNALNSFVGYADKKASEKKVLRDVFTKDDMYFNSGDILVEDLFGYYYFKDRTGDTFRQVLLDISLLDKFTYPLHMI